MLRGLLVIVAALSHWALAQGPVYTSTSTDYGFFSTCTTLYGSTGSQPTPIPTDYLRASYLSTINTIPTKTLKTTIYVTANTTTGYVETLYTEVFQTVTSTIPTSTVVSVSHSYSTFATATSDSVICTAGASAPSTITSYSGTYTPTPGQSTSSASFATSVTCTFLVTTSFYLFPTYTSGTTTVTYTPSTPNSIVPITETITGHITVAETTVSTTSISTEYVAVSSIKTISTSCAPTTTTTYAARCAPTNLIGAINNQGLQVDFGTTYANSSLVAPGHSQADGDASLCCQLCVDNEGCAAMLYFAESNACELVYTAPDSCGAAYEYRPVNGTIPGEGNVLSTGCGTIDLVT